MASVAPQKKLISGPDGLSYGDLFDRIPRIGALLESLNVDVADRVIILSSHDDAVASLFFGLIAHGVTAVLLNPEATTDELELLIEASDAGAIFADDNLIESGQLESAGKGNIPVISIAARKASKGLRGLLKRKVPAANDDAFPAILSRFESSEWSLPDFDEATIAYILFTSGTTSRPKGVQISHKSLFAQMDTFVRHYGLDADSRILNILPLHHTDGLTHGVVVSLVAGATVLRPMRFSVDRLPELLDLQYKERVSHLITVPSVLSLARQIAADCQDAFDYPDFRFVISTAAYLDPGLWREFQDTFGVRVVNVYGLTETVCEACYCGPDDESFRIGTVGKPVDCEARVVDEDGNPLPRGETGELALRGSNIMSGYFRMPEETAAVLRDGWFLTGDLAALDEDGFVSIVGRKKSVIVTGGHNVYPEDVTNALRSIDGVLDAVTFGLEDDIWGEKVVACVVPAKGAVLSVEAIAAQMLERASKEKLPRDIHIVDELPRGPAGKVIIEDAKKLAVEAEASSTLAGGSDIEAVVFGIASEMFKMPVSELTSESGPMNTKGWSSLAHVEFLMGIEKAYSIRLDARDIMNIDSLAKAVSITRSKLAN